MRRFGYELPESGSYRNGYAHVDTGSILLSLVGDFEGMYTFDLLSGKKKKRSFQDKGSCLYSCSAGSVIGSLRLRGGLQIASTGYVLTLDPRMNKCFNSFNAYLITTQQVIQLVPLILPVHSRATTS